MTSAAKLVSMLTPAQRKLAGAQLILMLIGTVLEILGVGLVIPALVLLTDNDITHRFPRIATSFPGVLSLSHERLIIMGMLGIVGITLIKVIFIAYLTWRQNVFVFGLQVELSQRLFAGYIRQPYVFHLQRNSAELIRNAISQVADIQAVAQQGLILLTELLVILGIFLLLLSVEPVGALVVFSSLGLAGWGFNRAVRTRTRQWGQARQRHEGLRIQHLQQGLGAAKDIKVLGREDEFLGQYYLHNAGNGRVAQLQSAVSAMPRLWLELLAAVGLVGFIMVMMARGQPIALLVPTLGLFAAAVFRIMPSMNRIVSAVQGVRYSWPMVASVYDDLQMILENGPMARGGPLPLTEALTLENVTYSYPSSKAQVLQEVTLSVPRGTSLGIIGGSGAGKSTLVDVVLGLLTPDAGAVRVDGTDIQTNVRSWQDQIGYVPQFIYLTDDTLRRNIAFGLGVEHIDDAAVWRAVRAAQLEQFVRSLPDGLDTSVGERGVRLSGGQRQRIGIARALYHDPAVLVLDEASSALDTVTERGVMEAVRDLRGDKTLIIVAHRLSTVEQCDRICRLEAGRLVENGDASTVLRNARSA